MEIIIYTNSCLSCKEGERLFMINKIAKENNLNLRTVRTFSSKDNLDQARSLSKLTIPFIWYNGNSIPFYGSTEKDIKDLIWKK